MQYQCVHSIETASCREQSITEIPPVSLSRGASTLSRKLCFRVTSTWGRGSSFLGCWFVLWEGRAQLLGVNSLAPALKQLHLLKSLYQKIATGLRCRDTIIVCLLRCVGRFYLPSFPFILRVGSGRRGST